MQIKIMAVSGLALLSLIACDSKERVKAPVQDTQAMAPAQTAPVSHEITVREVIQANSYTYLRVTEGDQEYWIATTKQPIEEGVTLYYDQGLEMKQFASKELDRTFDSIWFVSQFHGGANTPVKAEGAVSPYGNKQEIKAEDVRVAKLDGGVSVQDLFTNMQHYDGQTVSIRGQVTKFNANIMGRNWVHIQDGTKAGNHFDLTVTTKADVQLGAVVVFKGAIHLNKDFGAGYFYELIMEDAVLANDG